MKESDKTITTCLYFGKEWRNMKEGAVDMTMRQEVYEKIMRLPEDGIKLILVMADEIARQCGVFYDWNSTIKREEYDKIMMKAEFRSELDFFRTLKQKCK